MCASVHTSLKTITVDSPIQMIPLLIAVISLASAKPIQPESYRHVYHRFSKGEVGERDIDYYEDLSQPRYFKGIRHKQIRSKEDETVQANPNLEPQTDQQRPASTSAIQASQTIQQQTALNYAKKPTQKHIVGFGVAQGPKINDGVFRGNDYAIKQIENNAKIINYEQSINEHNNYKYAYETGNGIKAQEIRDGAKIQGAHSYVGHNGKLYNVAYTVDLKGFHPSEGPLPNPTPISEAISKSIEKDLQAEATGTHRGHYKEDRTEKSEIKPQQVTEAPKSYHQSPLKQVKTHKNKNQDEKHQTQISQKQYSNKLQKQNFIVVHELPPYDTHLVHHHEAYKLLKPEQQLEGYKVLNNQNRSHRDSAFNHQNDPDYFRHQVLENTSQMKSSFLPEFEVKMDNYVEPKEEKRLIVPKHENTDTEDNIEVTYIAPAVRQIMRPRWPRIVYHAPMYIKTAQDYIIPHHVAKKYKNY